MATIPSPLISVVIPVYKGEHSVGVLYDRLATILQQTITHDFELILVDDASPDQAWRVIQQLVDQDPRVKGIQLSRNFGQYMALTAGLDQARGEWVVIMDCDLQDVPEEIPNLYHKALEGYDVVLAQRVERHDHFFKKLCSRTFYAVFSYLTDTHQDPSTSQFGIYHQRVIRTLLSMRERLRFLPAFLGWIGYNQTAIPLQHAEREYGKSGYSFQRLLELALDTIISFSDKPLRLTVKLGFTTALLALLYGVFIVIRAEMGFIEPMGWNSLMAGVTFFSGLIILLIGINGLYLSKIFENVKARPLYIINRTYTHNREGVPASQSSINSLGPINFSK